MPLVPNPIVIHSKNKKLIAKLDLKGGMLSELTSLDYGQIFHRASWLDDSIYGNELGLMNHMSGTWPCVPFGVCQNSDNLVRKDFMHGMPCSSLWQVLEQSSNAAKLKYRFPDDYVLGELVQEIILEDSQVNFSLSITPNYDCALPLGLHPVFPVDNNANKLEIVVNSKVASYPCQAEKGVSVIKPNCIFDSLGQLQDDEGKNLDLRFLPLSFATEEIVQLINPNGKVVLVYPNRDLRVELRWDKDILPSSLLWVSNKGRRYSPWSGQNQCLGVEPICSAWDITEQSFKDNNSITKQGIRTLYQFKKGLQVDIKYSLSLFKNK